MEIKKRLTKNPGTKPDYSDLPFGKYFTDHMFIMDYTSGKGWHDPRIVPYGPLDLEPSAMVFHYGQAIFEGLKAYSDGNGKVLLFRPEKNFSRLNVSGERLCIPNIDEKFALHALMELIKTDIDWVPTAENTSLYLRPYVIATQPALGVHPSGNYMFIIIMSPVGPYYASGLNPVKICIEDNYVRAIKGGTGFTKASANYAISLKGQARANSLGYAQTLWLDGVEKKYIEEVGSMNVFFKIDGEVVTPELSGSILPGITRDSVITLLKDWGVVVNEKRLSIDELYEAYENGKLEEAFGTGTAAVISPIGELNWAGRTMIISGGNIGELSGRLYSELTGIQYGKVMDTRSWVTSVE